MKKIWGVDVQKVCDLAWNGPYMFTYLLVNLEMSQCIKSKGPLLVTQWFHNYKKNPFLGHNDYKNKTFLQKASQIQKKKILAKNILFYISQWCQCQTIVERNNPFFQRKKLLVHKEGKKDELKTVIQNTPERQRNIEPFPNSQRLQHNQKKLWQKDKKNFLFCFPLQH